MVRFTETGEGHHSPFKVPVRWNLESFWIYGARFSPQRYEKTFADLKGNPLVTEEFTFDWAKETVRFERIDHVRHLNTERVLSVPPDTLTSDGIATALRALPYGSSSPVTIHLLTNEPKLYKVTFEIQGQEKVKTQAGEFICYKVKMDIDLGFLNLFKVFGPDIFFWFTVDPPHFWVQYEGPEAGRGSPGVVRLLSEFRSSGGTKK